MTWMSHYKAEILKDLGGYKMTDQEARNLISAHKSGVWIEHPNLIQALELSLEKFDQVQKLRAGLTEIIKDSEEFVNLYSKEGTLTLEQTNLCNHFGNIATNTLGESK